MINLHMTFPLCPPWMKRGERGMKVNLRDLLYGTASRLCGLNPHMKKCPLRIKELKERERSPRHLSIPRMSSGSQIKSWRIQSSIDEINYQTFQRLRRPALANLPKKVLGNFTCRFLPIAEKGMAEGWARNRTIFYISLWNNTIPATLPDIYNHHRELYGKKRRNQNKDATKMSNIEETLQYYT